MLRQILFASGVGYSILAKSLNEKNNHSMYQEENPHRGFM